MARKERKVVGKEKFSFGMKTQKGKEAKSGVTLKFEDGNSKVLLTPSGKGTKYAYELGVNQKITNDGTHKVDDKGQPLQLTPEQRSYRSGYLDAQKDAARVYKAKKAGGKK